jgi:hypothetical protein
LTSSLVSAGVVVGAWLGAATIQQATPDQEALYAPFQQPGRIGTALDLRCCSVRVRSVAGGRRLTPLRADGTPSALGSVKGGYPTTGLWVVVTMELADRGRQPVNVGSLALIDRHGRRYVADSQTAVSTSLGHPTLQPGLTVTGDAVFEVPADAVGPGLSLHVSQTSPAYRDDESAIDLGTTDGSRRAWSSTSSVPIRPIALGALS